MVALFMAFQIADVLLTYAGFKIGGVELNPVGLYWFGAVGFWQAAVGKVLISYAVIRYIQARKGKAFVLRGLTGFMGLVVGWNAFNILWLISGN